MCVCVFASVCEIECVCVCFCLCVWNRVCVCVCVWVMIKTMQTPDYHHNGFLVTHAFGHMMYIYIHHYIYIWYTHHENNVPSRISPQWLYGNYAPCLAFWALFGSLVPSMCPYIMCPNTWVAIKPLWWWLGGHIAFMITYILRPSWC